MTWTLDPRARFLILARESTKRQDSAAQQEKECRAYIANVLRAGPDAAIAVKYDHGVSGLDERRMEEIVAACAGAPGSKASPKHVVVYDQSRFSRLAEDAQAHYRYLLGRAGWLISRVLGSQRSGNARADALTDTLEAGQATAHSEMLRAKVPGGMRESVLLGCWVGRPPFGYLIKGEVDAAGKRVKRTQRLVVEPTGAAVVKRIFREYAAGRTLAEVARDLNAEEVPGPFARYNRPGATRWRETSLRVMLSNSAYRGTVEWQDARKDDAHPALVDRRTWQRCQERLAASAGHRRQPHPDGLPYVLSGLLQHACEQTGGPKHPLGLARPMFGGGGVAKDATPAERIRYAGYVCKACRTNRRVGQVAVERAALDVIVRFLAKDDARGELERRAKRYVTAQLGDARADESSERRARLEKERDNLLSAIRAGVMTNEDARKDMKQIKDGLADLDAAARERLDPREVKAEAARWLKATRELIRRAGRVRLAPRVVNDYLAALKPQIDHVLWDHRDRSIWVSFMHGWLMRSASTMLDSSNERAYRATL